MRFSKPFAACALLGLFCVSCDRKPLPADPEEAPSLESMAAVVPAVDLTESLGFAAHVPADADFYFAWKNGDQMVDELLDLLLATGIATEETLTLEADDDGVVPDEGIEEAEQTAETFEEDLQEMAQYVGDESFLFVGGGVGLQLETLTTMYRDFSAGLSGTVIELLGQSLSGEKSFEDFESATLNEEQFEEWFSELMEVMEDESRFRFPSVVMGWRPAAGKHQEILDGLEEAMAGSDEEESSMRRVEFTHQGILMKGSQGDGSGYLDDFVADLREKLEEMDPDSADFESISKERVERLVDALEDFEFTVAWGSHEGYLMFYMGNGEEGFQLAPSVEASLASSGELDWAAAFADKDIVFLSYASEQLMRAGLPLIDNSPSWTAAAAALDPSVPDFREASRMLGMMADLEAGLAERDVSAWSALVMRDQGLVVETCGGWANPDINYEAPLAFAPAAEAISPAIRMHWVQNRERRDLSWRRMELLGTAIEHGLARFLDTGGAESWGGQEEAVDFVFEQIRRLNTAYRDEFRGGIGDEVGLVLDLKGMTPPLPGIPATVVEELKIPRFVLARPVTDRAKLGQSGESLVKVWEESIFEINERFDWVLPPLVPQRIESNELETHYFPLGVTGGDFIPGVYLNDRVWMVSTSRSMAEDFSKHGDALPSTDTGVLIEVDFQAIGEWVRDSYSLVTKDPELALEDPLDPANLDDDSLEEGARQVKGWLSRIRSYRYHHRMESGRPRTTCSLAIAPAS